MNQKGSLFLYLVIVITAICLIGGIYFVTQSQIFQKDEKLDEQRRWEIEQQVKKTFVPGLDSLEE